MRPRPSARRNVRHQASRAGGSRTGHRTAGSLKRREFLGLVGAASLATALGRTANAAPRRDKSNLLVLWTDQERKDLLRVSCKLFNLSEDPYETRHLYSSGKHDDVIAALREKIHAWQKTVKDTAAV